MDNDTAVTTIPINSFVVPRYTYIYYIYNYTHFKEIDVSHVSVFEPALFLAIFY